MTSWIRVCRTAAPLAVCWLVLLGTLCQVEGSKSTMPMDDKVRGICQRKYIRNQPASLDSLRGCKVIEGSLQIALVHSDSPKNWENYSYPELREITGYLLLFDFANLTSMRNLFPNLAVIRGQELVDTHALVISSANELQEIGLPSLTDIQRGSIWIVDNPHLCYVDTIDWNKIANESEAISEGVTKNKPLEQCPNTCKSECPKSELDGRHLCWSSRDCQKVFKNFCPLCGGKPCTDRGECCSKQCLGGCSVKDSPSHCYVCKHVIFNGTCTEECPFGFYEYLKRRCVTRDECLKINAAADVSKSSSSTHQFHGKIYEDGNGTKLCVLECPKDTELAPNKTACIPCKNSCRKNCPGTLVDSVEKARELAGCTRITGVLRISIRRSSSVTTGTIVKELKQNLDKIEEIDHYLVITHTYAIVSLDFLENLRVIRGEKLEDNTYGLVVRSNENLMELWDLKPNRSITIQNKKARVLFHYNSKLCQQKIRDFVIKAGFTINSPSEIDIGITNGDKVTCNTKVLQVYIDKKTNNSVLIKYENFRRNLTLTSHLLSYEIHYKEAIDYPKRNVSKYDDRDPCGDDDWTILEYPKISDAEVGGGMDKEPHWEHPKLITNLKHYAWYALYVKTIVIPDESSINNNTGAESNIEYFKTLPGVPSRPQEFKLAAGGPNTITLTWTPPVNFNGELEKFNIWLQTVREDQDLQDQRDYCKKGRTKPTIQTVSSGSGAKSTVAPFLQPPLKDSDTVTVSTQKKDVDCCSCSASGSKPSATSYASIHYQDDMMNNIINHVFIPSSIDQDSIQSRRKRSLQQMIRRSVEDSSDNSAEKMNEMVFPGEERSPGQNQPRMPRDMAKVQEIRFDPNIKKYTFSLKNLTHFTTYIIGIQACRSMDKTQTNNSTEIENDTRTCSDLTKSSIQTDASPTADNIDPRSIFINVTENRLHLTWAEPLNPNGVIMGYVVKVQRWDKNDLAKQECITRKSFQLKKNYTFLEGLHPGNYSVRIKVASLARDSEYTPDRWFIIEDTEGGFAGFWALVILLPLCFMILIGAALGYFYIRTKGIIDGRRIFSANPEYMSNVDIPEEWEVPRDKLKLIEVDAERAFTKKYKELGQGSFGTVLEGILRDFILGYPEVPCAVKTVSDDATSEDRAFFLREAALMVKLDCKCHHVVKLLGVVSKTQPTYVIMELMHKGDLKNYLRSRRPGTSSTGEPPPTLRQILRMAAEIADGMAYLQKHKLVHRDLAARNCMVAEDLCVKVGDFGMTKEVIESEYYRKQTRGLLPVRWMAPESLRDGVFTGQTDVWSFGVVIWEMATLAAQPYQGLANSQVLEYVLSGRTMERPENCPDILFDLMTLCWETDPRHRPNFIQILDKLQEDLDPSFAQVSFYHSSEGRNYRDQIHLQSRDDALIEIRLDSSTPLATLDDDLDDLDDYDSDDDVNGLHHHIVDDLGDTPSRLLISTPSKSTITKNVSSSLTNGLALNPLVIHSSAREDSSNGESVNLANHALPAPPTSSSSTNLQSTSRSSIVSSNYSPRLRTNSNNNNTNPRLPVSLNVQNSLSNRAGGGSSGGVPTLAGSTSSLTSSATANFISPVPNGVDALPPFSFLPKSTTCSSPKCSGDSPPSAKDEQSKVFALTGSGSACSTDSSKALLINHDGNNSKISNGSSGGSGGNGYIIRRGSPENNPVNRTTQC